MNVVPNPMLKIEHDVESDVLTIQGMRYSGELFRAFADGGLSLNEPFRIIKRGDGVITVESLKYKFEGKL